MSSEQTNELHNSQVLNISQDDFECNFYGIKYKPLSQQDLDSLKQKEINNIKKILEVDSSNALKLLNVWNWKTNGLIVSYYENSEETLLNSGVFLNKDGIKITKNTSRLMFSICYNSENMKMVSLPCDHEFCIDCYRTCIKGKIDQRHVSSIKCPRYYCKATLSENDVKKIVSEDYFNKYLEYSTHLFVTSRNEIHWCPFPNCTSSVECKLTEVDYLKKSIPTVKCRSDHEHCFGCGLNESHEPASCAQVKEWLTKCTRDTQTISWKAKNTRACPNCHVLIQKDGGCEHLTCRVCYHNFCWVCLSPGRHIVCDKSNTKAIKSSIIKSIRFLDYYERYKKHEQFNCNLQQLLEIFTKFRQTLK